MQRSPPLNSLKVFEAAARHRSFARASKELHVTAAAVSHQVGQLEHALGITLFKRLPRGVELTEAGYRYQVDVSAALGLVDRATAALSRSNIEGPLRISLPQSFAHLWFSMRVARLSQRYPELDLAVSSDDGLANVHDGDTDLALRFGPGNYPGLHVRHLMGDAATLLIATERLASMNKSGVASVVANSVLLEDDSIGTGEPWMMWAPWLREVGLSGNSASRRIKFSDNAMAVSACLAGAGVCIGRLSLALEYVRRRQLTALLPWRSTDFAYHMVLREADIDNPRVAALTEWLTGEVRVFADDAFEHCGYRVAMPVDVSLTAEDR